MSLTDQQFVEIADQQNYRNQDLVELKTVLHLPYFTSSGDYERIDGEIELEGVHYNYVKRKVSNDTLYLLCLPNEHKTKLYGSLMRFTEQSMDLPGNKDAKNTTLKKINILSDCLFEDNNYFINQPVSELSENNIFFSPDLQTTALPAIYQPPK